MKRCDIVMMLGDILMLRWHKAHSFSVFVFYDELNNTEIYQRPYCF
jgi:hypothetical protein